MASTLSEKRTRIAVVFGGRSSEHSISCLSASSVLAALDRTRFEVSAIGITRSGAWHQVSSDPADWRIVDAQLPSVASNGPPVVLAADPVIAASDVPGLVDVDVVFPVLHGAYGEDGTIQGLLELADLPYVGSGVLASAATMDKQVTKTLLAAADLPIGDHVGITDADWNLTREAVLRQIENLGYPLFVKPARSGSSLGISKVRSAREIVEAVEAARVHDRKVIAEKSVEHAREIECAVLAGLGHSRARASACAEITIGGDHEFYDFAAKYLDDTTELTVPADIPGSTHRMLGELAVRAFDALGCDGLARVDFFIGPDGQPVINEVNTMPGFTAISLFPRMWQASGLSYPELVGHLVDLALDRGVGLR